MEAVYRPHLRCACEGCQITGVPLDDEIFVCGFHEPYYNQKTGTFEEMPDDLKPATEHRES
jgi:hypothetical protein